MKKEGIFFWKRKKRRNELIYFYERVKRGEKVARERVMLLNGVGGERRSFRRREKKKKEPYQRSRKSPSSSSRRKGGERGKERPTLFEDEKWGERRKSTLREGEVDYYYETLSTKRVGLFSYFSREKESEKELPKKGEGGGNF